MTIENLPRPWLLAALTGLKVAELLGPDDSQPNGRPWQRRAFPRPDSRRRRLGEAPGRRRQLDSAEEVLN